MRGVSTGYALAYRLGFTPWERYARAAAASIAVLLDREEADRSRPLGRALDLGCGLACRLTNWPGGAGRLWASTTFRARSTERTAGASQAPPSCWATERILRRSPWACSISSLMSAAFKA